MAREMTAREFETLKRKICAKYFSYTTKSCPGCPLDNYCQGDDVSVEDVVSLVEQWATLNAPQNDDFEPVEFTEVYTFDVTYHNTPELPHDILREKAQFYMDRMKEKVFPNADNIHLERVQLFATKWRPAPEKEQES